MFFEQPQSPVDKSDIGVVHMMWMTVEQIGFLVDLQNLFRAFSSSAQKLSTKKSRYKYLIFKENNQNSLLSTGLISH